MTAASLALLDQAELMHLSLEASRNGDSAASLAYLKEAVARPDASAAVHLLLGAEYAQLRMYERAIPEMEAAVAVDPSLAIARFQLGLLLLTSGDGARAIDILGPLEELGEQHALSHFGRGLIHLVRDELPLARQLLEQGVALNLDNPALNVDMRRIIDEVSKLPIQDGAQVAADPVAGEDVPVDASARHIFLSAYTGSRNQ